MKDTTTKPLTISCNELEEGIDLEIIYTEGYYANGNWEYQGDYIEPEIVRIKRGVLEERVGEDVDSDMLLRFFDIEQLLDESEIVVNEQRFGQIKDLI
jgi:hypothetical protein